MKAPTRAARPRFRRAWLLLPLALGLAYVVAFVPLGRHDLLPGDEGQSSTLALDPASPWPKFRANALQNGRSPVQPRLDAAARPWTYPTGKGIFSSPVVDGEGTVYVGSADHWFYALRRDGSLTWRFQTGEIIDSSALLDDQGRVYFGSGDGRVYCLDRASGKEVWSFVSQTPGEVETEFGIKTHNLAWFEGNIGILPGGDLLAPNDNNVVYRLDRVSGKRVGQYLGNEMVWSLPAVNPATGRIFFGTTFMAAKTTFAYDSGTGKRLWTQGGLGSVAATGLLTSSKARGALVLGSFDGYVRALAQDSGKVLWSYGARDHIYASPAQLADGTIIQPSADGSVHALDPRTGKEIWAFDSLEPIRSSPAVGGDGRIYVGSGEGRLFCLEADGRLRWSYLCIEDERNDLNASPALGSEGVYIAGESGGIFFVPYDYPLSPAGRADPRCALGPGAGAMAAAESKVEGPSLVWTSPFGALQPEAPKTLEANAPVTLSLLVSQKGRRVLSALERKGLVVEVSGSPRFEARVSADGRFLTLLPRETWTGPAGGRLEIKLGAGYRTGLSRFGLKFFGGRRAGRVEARLAVEVPPRPLAPLPYPSPQAGEGRQALFELSRLAAPQPTMLPSWNQIGFDSLHYLSGSVQALPRNVGGHERLLLWTVGGRLDGGQARVDPSLEARFPLVLDWDGGLLTIHNYDGFKTNFVGSWDMPFAYWRLAARAEPATGAPRGRVALNALALCDQIKFYGAGLKLLGLSDFRTGEMSVAGAMNLGQADPGRAGVFQGRAEAAFSATAGEARAVLARPGVGGLSKGAHVYSLLLTDEATGEALPLYYTKRTAVDFDGEGRLLGVGVGWDRGEAKAGTRVKAWLMVDTWPAASGSLVLP